MSDSLSDTCSVRRCTFTSSTKELLEFDDVDDELSLFASWSIDWSWFEEEEELEFESLFEPAVTVSPFAPETDAIVPFAGARSLVDASASSAESTLSCALCTFAWAAS